jgi:long-chain acyl-CoA synthetase
VLKDAGAELAIVETAEHAALVVGSGPTCPRCARYNWIVTRRTLSGGAQTLPTMPLLPAGPLEAGSLATIITPGTTGAPKGCELTHGNFLFELGNAVQLLDDLFEGGPGEQASTLLFLPLAHVFARIVQIAPSWPGPGSGTRRTSGS